MEHGYRDLTSCPWFGEASSDEFADLHEGLKVGVDVRGFGWLVHAAGLLVRETQFQVRPIATPGPNVPSTPRPRPTRPRREPAGTWRLLPGEASSDPSEHACTTRSPHNPAPTRANASGPDSGASDRREDAGCRARGSDTFRAAIWSGFAARASKCLGRSHVSLSLLPWPGVGDLALTVSCLERLSPAGVVGVGRYAEVVPTGRTLASWSSGVQRCQSGAGGCSSARDGAVEAAHSGVGRGEPQAIDAGSRGQG